MDKGLLKYLISVKAKMKPFCHQRKNGNSGAAGSTFHELSGKEQTLWSVISWFFPVLAGLSFDKFLHQKPLICKPEQWSSVFHTRHQEKSKSYLPYTSLQQLLCNWRSCAGFLRRKCFHILLLNLNGSLHIQLTLGEKTGCRESSKILRAWEYHFIILYIQISKGI